MKAALRLLLAALALLLVAPLAAHTRSESHSSWTIEGGRIAVTYAIPNIELRKLADGALPSVGAWHHYVERNLWVTIGGGRCPLAGPLTALAADAVFQRVSFAFACPPGPPAVLHSTAFLDVAPRHMHFAQIQRGGDFIEQVFTREQPQLDLGGGEGGALRSAGFLTYVGMGIEHILTGVDHMSFLLGLVLISRRLRDLLFVVTGFTLGHSLTLGLAVTGLVRPHAEYIDALVALTILLIGAENIALATHRAGTVSLGVVALLAMVGVAELAGLQGLPPALLIGTALFSACYLLGSAKLGDAGRLRLIVTLVFGLIHGFGFAAGLLEMELPREKLFQLLLGFNLGVEVGQIGLVLALVGIAALFRRLRIAPPRALVVDLSCALLAGAGTYWFVSRSIALA